jgi:hypothetical protein
MKKTLLFAFLISASSLFAQSFSTGTQTLLTNLSAEISISSDTNMTTLTLAGPSNAWFAIGFGGLNMSAGADVFRTDGTTIVDARSTSRVLPPADGSQDWSLVSNTVSGSVRTIVATRANNTGDSNDFVFDPGATSISVIYAHGTSPTYAYHGGTRGFTTLGVTLGTSEDRLLSFDMFPNPAIDEVNIQLPTGTEKANVSVYDRVGRLVSTQTITPSNSKVNIANLSSGMYLLRVNTDGKIGTKRLIKS